MHQKLKKKITSTRMMKMQILTCLLEIGTIKLLREFTNTECFSSGRGRFYNSLSQHTNASSPLCRLMDYNEDDSPECLLKSDKMQAYSSEKDDRSVHRTLLSVHPEMGVSLKVENKLLGEIN